MGTKEATMNKLFIIILCFLVLIAVVPLLAKGNKPAPVARYYVVTSRHAQPIAVCAGIRAWSGLDHAAAHSPVILAATGVKPPSDVIKPGKK